MYMAEKVVKDLPTAEQLDCEVNRVRRKMEYVKVLQKYDIFTYGCGSNSGFDFDAVFTGASSDGNKYDSYIAK